MIDSTVIRNYRNDLEIFRSNHEDKFHEPDLVSSNLQDLALYTIQEIFSDKGFFSHVKLTSWLNSWLVELEDGCLVSFVFIPKQSRDAFVERCGSTYFIAVSLGLIEMIFDISISIWRHPQFPSVLGDEIRKVSMYSNNQIPQGFESILIHEILEEIRNSKVEKSIEAKNNVSQSFIDTAYYKCFQQGIYFLYLHEIAHILLGHIDKLDKVYEFSSLHHYYTDSQCKIVLPMELEADRFALQNIFTRIHYYTVPDSDDYLNNVRYLWLLSAAIGCMLFPLAFYGVASLYPKEKVKKLGKKPVGKEEGDEFYESHPPLWFRACDIVLAEDAAAYRQWFGQKQGQQRFEGIRFKQKNIIYIGLASLSRVYPTFGNWILTVSDSALTAEHEILLRQARERLDPYKSELQALSKRFKLLPN